MGTTTPIASKGATGTFKSIVLIPKRLRIGVSWSATYTVGKSVVIRKSRVAGRATSKLPGVGALWRIRVSEEWTGTTASGANEETIVWSPKLHLPIARTIDRNLQGSFAEDLRSTVSLVSTSPLAAVG
jgi:hypothetical protein